MDVGTGSIFETVAGNALTTSIDITFAYGTNTTAINGNVGITIALVSRQIGELIRPAQGKACRWITMSMRCIRCRHVVDDTDRSQFAATIYAVAYLTTLDVHVGTSSYTAGKLHRCEGIRSPFTTLERSRVRIVLTTITTSKDVAFDNSGISIFMGKHTCLSVSTAT